MKQVPSPPIGYSPSGREIKEWALALTAYLRTVQPASNPTAVLLESWTPEAKATVDGLMMFDPTSQSIMLVVNGAWVPVLTGVAP